MPDLPIEILHEIFAYFSSPLRVRQAHKFPWYLGQVCSRWRALFFSMRSTFWRKIQIEWYFYYDDLHSIRFCKRVQMILAFFLSRTQGASFSFSLFRTPHYPDVKYVRWILKDLLDHSRQWEEASILLASADVNLLRSAKGHLPLLKRLEIMTPPYYEGNGMVHPSFAAIFRDTPLLTHVVVEDISMWEFNWSSLTILSMGHQKNITKSLAILQKSVNLVDLTINMFLRVPRGMHGLMIRFPRLECLSIEGVKLLTALETPALRRLEILDYDRIGDSTVTADEMVDFLCRSRLKLTFWRNKMGYKDFLHTSTLEA